MNPTTPGTDDGGLDALCRSLRQGDDVLGQWYEVAFPRVRRLARGFLADRGAADDVAQDVMLELIDTLDRWDPARPFGPWLRTVVLRRSRNHRRSESRRVRREEGAGIAARTTPLPTPEEAAATGELSALVDQALGLLPDREREVFVLCELEGSTPKDAAGELGVAASTVRAALSMARRRLREALADHVPPRVAGGGAS